MNIVSGKKFLLDMINDNADNPFYGNIFEIDAFRLLRFEGVNSLEKEESIINYPISNV
jgi:hypothetical protein